MNNVNYQLSKGAKEFKSLSKINYYKPTKIKDRYGYQYLIKGSPTAIKGALHEVSELDTREFGLYDNAYMDLSTNSQLELGCLIEYNSEFYAIKKQKSFNEVTGLKHYFIESAIGYYDNFIRTEAPDIMLGNNSARFFLDFATGQSINLIPARFQIMQTNQSYFSFAIFETTPISNVFQNEENKLSQFNRDRVKIFAVNCTTFEIQSFANTFNKEASQYGLGLSNIITFSDLETYSQALDIKANVWVADISVNYNIVTEQTLEQEQKILNVVWDLIFK